jgi:NAD(P)H-flavin reductase
MENQAMSVLTQFPVTKSGILKFKEQLKSECFEGNRDIIELEVYRKVSEEVMKSLKDDSEYKDALMQAVNLYPEKTFSINACGSPVSITKAQKSTYDYSVCNDDTYNRLVEQLEQIKEQIKIREQILKSGINAETGESFQKPVQSVSEFLTIKFEK